MPQPYDYSLGVPSPQESFLAGVQSWQQQQQINAQMARAEAERAEVERKIAAVERKAQVFQRYLGPGATIDDRNAAMRELPDDVNAIQTLWSGMDEGRRRAYLEAGRSVYNDLMPRPDGTVNIEGAIANLNLRADAAKNSGDTVLEGQLRGLSTTLQNQPASARALQGIIDLQVRAVDPDAADKMTGMGDVSGLLRAANIDPFGDKGREIFQNITFSKGQILYQGTTPDGKPYVGTLQDYLARFGGGGEAPVAGETPTAATGKPRTFSNVNALPADLQVGDIVNGKRYNGGPTNQPSSWGSPKGGQTGSTSSDGFR